MYFFLFNSTKLQVWYILYRCSMCDSTDINTIIEHPVSWNCISPSNGIVRWWFFPEFGAELPLDNCNWPTFMKCKRTKRLSLSFAAILVSCAPSGEMHNYYTPHIIKENFENFLIHRCNYILLSQVYCVWQVVKTPTIVSNNLVYWGENLCSVCPERFTEAHPCAPWYPDSVRVIRVWSTYGLKPGR